MKRLFLNKLMMGQQLSQNLYLLTSALVMVNLELCSSIQIVFLLNGQLQMESGQYLAFSVYVVRWHRHKLNNHLKFDMHTLQSCVLGTLVYSLSISDDCSQFYPILPSTNSTPQSCNLKLLLILSQFSNVNVKCVKSYKS